MWSLADADVDSATLAMHRQMMGTGDLGAPRSLPVTVDGKRVGTLQVRVPQGVVPAVDKDFQSSVNRLLAAGALGAALVALVVGVYTARRATAPIAELTRAADDLAAGQRDRRATTIPNNEIGQLATAFNTMADRVERRTNCAAPSPPTSRTNCAPRSPSSAANSRPSRTASANRTAK